MCKTSGTTSRNNVPTLVLWIVHACITSDLYSTPVCVGPLPRRCLMCRSILFDFVSIKILRDFIGLAWAAEPIDASMLALGASACCLPVNYLYTTGYCSAWLVMPAQPAPGECRHKNEYNYETWLTAPDTSYALAPIGTLSWNCVALTAAWWAMKLLSYFASNCLP